MWVPGKASPDIQGGTCQVAQHKWKQQNLETGDWKLKQKRILASIPWSEKYTLKSIPRKVYHGQNEYAEPQVPYHGLASENSVSESLVLHDSNSVNFKKHTE